MESIFQSQTSQSQMIAEGMKKNPKLKIVPCPKCHKIPIYSLTDNCTVKAYCKCSKDQEFYKEYSLKEFNELSEIGASIPPHCFLKKHSDKQAVMFCKTCQRYFCESCMEYHNEDKPSHETNKINGLKISSTCEEMNCRENAVNYCKDCGMHICNKCTQNHRRHQCQRCDKENFLSKKEFDIFIKDVEEFRKVHLLEFEFYRKLDNKIKEAYKKWASLIKQKEEEHQELMKYFDNISSSFNLLKEYPNFQEQNTIKNIDIGKVQQSQRNQVLNSFNETFNLKWESIPNNLPELISERKKKEKEDAEKVIIKILIFFRS